MKMINTMGVGMHPLNYASRLVKMANDVMFSIAVNDPGSAESRLAEVERIAADLRRSIQDAVDKSEPSL
ncbi:hypothetical protein J7E62_27635 [Variovorax paradoxus]|nr:hypothetical protein [Variovorax paradoxus]